MDKRLAFLLLCVLVIFLLILKKEKLEKLVILGHKPRNRSVKVILDWTGFFSANMVNRWSKFQRECQNLTQKCMFTMDKNYAEEADAIIFHVRQPGWNFEKIPNIRLPWQRYVMFLRESPTNTNINLQKGNNFFNWTMTHRRDSDIWWPAAKVEPIEKGNGLDMVEMHFVRNKSKMVAWWVSNCHTASKRELYAKELQRFIQVDIFGSCGPLKCGREESECNELLKRDYKFYLSFENSICDDYLTEKFYDRINDFVVPIVLRGADYRKTGPEGFPRAPEHSFIAADDYESPEKLAEYLKYLSHNMTEYLRYFQWRKKWRVRNYDIAIYSNPPLCKLCEMLHENHSMKIMEDVEKWWSGDQKKVCDDNFAMKLIK